MRPLPPGYVSTTEGLLPVSDPRVVAAVQPFMEALARHAARTEFRKATAALENDD